MVNGKGSFDENIWRAVIFDYDGNPISMINGTLLDLPGIEPKLTELKVYDNVIYLANDTRYIIWNPKTNECEVKLPPEYPTNWNYITRNLLVEKFSDGLYISYEYCQLNYDDVNNQYYTTFIEERLYLIDNNGTVVGNITLSIPIYKLIYYKNALYFFAVDYPNDVVCVYKIENFPNYVNLFNITPQIMGYDIYFEDTIKMRLKLGLSHIQL